MAGWRHFPTGIVREIHDADTLTVEVHTIIEADCGFGHWVRTLDRQYVDVRLFGLSAPEVTGNEKIIGLSALAIARELVGAELPDCQLWTWKASFNRYVGRVLVAGKFDLVRAILSLGGGHAWDGKTKRRAFTEFPVSDVESEIKEYDRLLARDFK